MASAAVASAGVVISLGLWSLFWGGLCAALAAWRGRDPSLWFFAGLLFSLFAVIALLILDVNARREAAAADRRACPHCAEPIRHAAKVCRYCGRDV